MVSKFRYERSVRVINNVIFFYLRVLCFFKAANSGQGPPNGTMPGPFGPPGISGTPPGPGYTPVNVPPPMIPPRGPGFIPPPVMPVGGAPGDIRLPPPIIPPFSVPPPGFGFGGPPAPPTNHNGIVISHL